MADTSIPGFSPTTIPRLAGMPLEIIGNIMSHLGREDQEACRQVRALNSEATRALFRTIHVRAEDQMPHAGSIISEPALSVYVRAIVFSEEFREATLRKGPYHYCSTDWFGYRLKQLMVTSRQLHLTSIELESLDLNSLITLFSKAEPVLDFLKKAERFHLVLHNGRVLGDWQYNYFDPIMLPDFEELPGRLPALRDLTLGFSRGTSLNLNEGPRMEHRLGIAMLQGFYPRLASLTLRKLVVWDGIALQAFLERHRETLKSLTIRDLYLIGSGDRANRESCLRWTFRLLTLIKNAAQLEHMSFEGQICARKWERGDIDTAVDVRISCRDVPQSPQFLFCPIRREVEAYVCQKRETLPFITIFGQKGKILQNAFHRSRDILREEYDELDREETLYLRSDYTWEYGT